MPQIGQRSAERERDVLVAVSSFPTKHCVRVQGIRVRNMGLLGVSVSEIGMMAVPELLA